MGVEALKKIQEEALLAGLGIMDARAVDEWRAEWLGRKGKLGMALGLISELTASERPEFGKVGNLVKETLEGRLVAMMSSVESVEGQLDWSFPGVEPKVGHLHLTSQTIREVQNIFSELGFRRARFPEVDWDYYAFESLNMPKDHPARDDWETFFIANDKGRIKTGAKGKQVLTPHTSNAQVREMERGELPIRLINISKTYRRQSGPRHLPVFHQFEGLLIDEGVSIANLKGVVDYFVKRFFGEGVQTRLRPHHFKFTEPSFELDISCVICLGTGTVSGGKCRICKGGWLELGGAGMVHPNVLKAGGVNPKKYSGLAFGWGVERTMIMRSGVNITDIRTLYKNDLGFLEQF